MIIASAPFRVSFGGGGSDLPTYFRKRKGAVLSTTINRSMYITIHRYFEPTQTLVKYSRSELVDDVGDLKHPILREVLRHMVPKGGLEISSTADVPSGTGLGSSSSFTVALLHAIHAHCGRYRSKEQLASQACKVEIDWLKEPIGKQDQYAAAYGGLNLIEFHTDDTVTVTPVILPHETVTRLDANLLLFFTGMQRDTRDILSKQSANMSEQDKIDTLSKMVDLTHEMMAHLISGELTQFGEALHRQWNMKQSLAKGITNPTLQKYYQQAKDAGALGGKVLGAGGGGFLLAYADLDKHDAIRNALSGLRELPFKLEGAGSRILYVGDR